MKEPYPPTPHQQPTHRLVDFWVTLYPGWQDCDPPSLYTTPQPPMTIAEGTRLIRITAALPKFGGSMIAHQDIQAVTTEVDPPPPPP